MVAGFNPLFAQGMTHATLQVLALDEVLTDQRKNRFAEGWWHVAQEYHKRAANVSKACWDLGVQAAFSSDGKTFRLRCSCVCAGTPADLARPGTVGKRTGATNFASLMGWQLLQLLLSTNAGTVKFARLQQCLVPPEKIVGSPDVLFPLLVRVVKALLAKKQAAVATPAPATVSQT